MWGTCVEEYSVTSPLAAWGMQAVARGSSGVGRRRCCTNRRFTTTSARANVSSMSAPVGIEKK